MTEFSKTFRIMHEICYAHHNCHGCPACLESGCVFDTSQNPAKPDVIVAITSEWERRNGIMNPTWTEWQNRFFPNAMEPICPRKFGSNKEVGCTSPPDCDKCRNTPIPNDIARKLGIKPIIFQEGINV